MSDDAFPKEPAEPAFQASRALVSAALGGLLCVAVPACSSGGDAHPGVLADATAEAADTSSTTRDASPSDVATTPDTTSRDTDGSSADCAAEAGVITSSTVDPTMTLEAFTKLCDARGGTVQLHSHCGGNNSCKGMSYDTGTQVLTEHTCKGLNTCAGYSCVDPC